MGKSQEPREHHKGQTWSPSSDDEGSTRDEFYDDEDLYSGSGSGCNSRHQCEADIGRCVLHDRGAPPPLHHAGQWPRPLRLTCG
ncbi:hypothetical protein EYF80_004006 [Liparis tanakae]|uniref:Uncharacterized protein n=1 Tax=Liparis tanakae TaxID=230148 RepID=A0A4Z2J6E2_9TELE|nr:hypothetical protein EYF80_004006 [Liparis tanakae]